jgi:hypothetical protein
MDREREMREHRLFCFVYKYYYQLFALVFLLLHIHILVMTFLLPPPFESDLSAAAATEGDSYKYPIISLRPFFFIVLCVCRESRFSSRLFIAHENRM